MAKTRGTRLVMVWADIDPEFASGFNRWHDEEHLPQRLQIPGFLSARRYRAADPKRSAGQRDRGRLRQRVGVSSQARPSIRRPVMRRPLRTIRCGSSGSGAGAHSPHCLK